MNTAFLPRLALVALCAALAPWTQAEPVSSARPSQEELMATYDTNRDGKLDEGEKEAMRLALSGGETIGQGGAKAARATARTGARADGRGAQMLEALFRQWDTNRDGRVDEGEKERAISSWKPRHPKMVERIDKNSDGTVDAAEKGAFIDEVQRLQNAVLERYDTNGNGLLDAAERAAMQADASQRRNRPTAP